MVSKSVHHANISISQMWDKGQRGTLNKVLSTRIDIHAPEWLLACSQGTPVQDSP